MHRQVVSKFVGGGSFVIAGVKFPSFIIPNLVPLVKRDLAYHQGNVTIHWSDRWHILYAVADCQTLVEELLFLFHLPKHEVSQLFGGFWCSP